MIELNKIRSELADLLADELEIPANASPRSDLPLPCVVVQPRVTDDYIQVTSFGAERINLQAVVLVAGGSPGAVFDALDDLLDKMRAALHTKTSACGLSFTFHTVGPPGRWQVGDVYADGAAVEISTERTI